MIHPLFLDVRPDYMQGCQDATSLLLAPVGTMPLFSVLHASVGQSKQAPVVLSLFPVTRAYRAAIRENCDRAEAMPITEFSAASYDPSDWLLFIDPRLYCVDALRLPAMLRDGARLQARATHLVAMAQHAGGTNEQVEVDTAGRVRRIQRYFDSATWPKLTGVACSFISVSCLRTRSERLVIESLSQLRTALTDRGVPSRDVPIRGGVFDLSRADELVRLNERTIMSPAAAAGSAHQERAAASLHPTARVIGRVVLHDGAVVERGVTLIGPSVIGARSRIGEDTVVAHSVIGNGVSVASGAVINYRVLFADDGLDRDSPSGPDAVDDDAAAPEIEAQNPALVRPFYSRVKIVIDSVIAAVSLLLLSPLFAVIAALIKIDSRGSVFFADLREGCDGTLFRCWKFRTMRQDASLRQQDLIERNDVDGPQFKLEKDPRLTRIGRWLRPMSLDELPQLFNVLLGTMSLIGPRPSPFRENQRCVPWRDARLSVRPGITGLWQVCRHDRPGGDFHQWIYFDLLYVQHMSFSLDLKILLATILTGGGQRNVSVHWLIPAPRLRA